MDVKHFPIDIKISELPNNVIQIVKNIRPDWREEDIRFKMFTDGITNKLIGCYSENDPKNIILVRIYGEKTDLFIDRAAEVKNFKLMNSNGYAPMLFATFGNGMVYEYIPGQVLNTSTCRDKAVYPLVATMLAKMHKLRYEDNIEEVPVLWDKFECFINLIPDRYSVPDKQLRFVQHFPEGKISFRNDLTEMKKVLEHVCNPIVFCHNDLLLANVICRGNSVSFIDYEYSGYNYQAYDIANHFNEFAGVSEFDCSLYPPEDFQLDWIRIYLKEFIGNGTALTEERVRQLYNDVCKFVPASHFFWAMWALVQSHNSCIDFDYIEYAVIRYREYKKSL